MAQRLTAECTMEPLEAPPPRSRERSSRGRSEWSRLLRRVIVAVMVAACSLLVAVRDQGRGTAISLPRLAALPARANATEDGQIWMLPLELELWQKRLRRKKLIQILNQVTETRRHRNRAQSLEHQGPDGSHLVKAGNEQSEKDTGSPQSSPPPKELMQLLQVEDRIRRLRHLRRIARARRAAAASDRKLAVLRRHPAQQAAVRLSKAAGYLALGNAAYRTASHAVKEVQSKQEVTVAKVPREQTSLRSAYLPAELKQLWEVSQPIIDYLLQAAALRAIRRGLAPKIKGPEAHVPDVALEDVAGIGAAKTEALEIVECLMAPARFASLGAKCPKGLLLTGPPGCGKTLLAKAIASRAAVPFISRSGADFNGRYAGTGTNLVKELFRTARALAPAVILIDELDYIGRRRGEERGGGLETDRSAALTQLLAEMDGFVSAEGIVVIGTTNRPDILDKALTRPGRFDRKVSVPLPDVFGRLKILRKHAERLALEHPGARKLTGPDSTTAPDWMGWAKRTPGFSGADLAGLVNEAAMAAAREGALGVGERHLQAAYSKQLIGLPSGRHKSAAEMNLTAVHEAGHAVVNEAMRASLGATGMDGFRTVAHVSIVPAGGTGGVTQFSQPEEAKRMPQSRRVLLAELAVDMGGRAAEELLMGRGEATMGAISDIDQATRMATEMVTAGGLSEVVGPRSVSVRPSEELLRQVDEEVNQLLRQALGAAREALNRNRELHEAVTEALLRSETMDGEVFKQLVEKHQVQPVKL